MVKKLASAESVRLKVLESLHEGWKMRPGPNQCFPLQQVWQEVCQELGSRLDDELSEGVWDGLRKEGLIEVHIMQNETGTEVAVGRISDAGRRYLEQRRDNIRTRRIAIFGAIAGGLGVVMSLIKFLLDMIE